VSCFGANLTAATAQAAGSSSAALGALQVGNGWDASGQELKTFQNGWVSDLVWSVFIMFWGLIV